MERPSFVDGGIYHVFNRGADKRTIFHDVGDYRRFLRGLWDFNDRNPARDPREVAINAVPRERLVEILCYCLMPNHFHLMLRQLQEGGIPAFMRKLGTGYAMYFNTKYDRSGVLFQGQYKAVPVDNDAYLGYLPHYIHLNPLALSMEKIKAGESRQIRALDRFQWSSYRAYRDVTEDRLVDVAFLNDFYRPRSYSEALTEWLSDSSELAPPPLFSP